MWRKIRGFGYAYSYSINPQPNEALISLHFYRSVNVPAAYKETKAILVCNFYFYCFFKNDRTFFFKT